MKQSKAKANTKANMVELPVRLMLRVEGEWWRAYLGAGVGYQERPDGPLLLGQIRMSVSQDPNVKSDFISLMTKILQIEIKRVTGVTRVDVKQRDAPPNERAGNA